ncbi:hypothetical protein GN156_15460 [bacterium LRH843]|nr:hypothetical protein [bacterium LRH843]
MQFVTLLGASAGMIISHEARDIRVLAQPKQAIMRIGRSCRIMIYRKRARLNNFLWNKRGVQMVFKRFNRTGKVLAFLGICFFASGIAFNETLGVSSTSDSLASLSIPLIVIGILLSITSNFFRRKREK